MRTLGVILGAAMFIFATLVLGERVYLWEVLGWALLAAAWWFYALECGQ